MSAAFSCREASRLATEALDHPLSFRGRVELRFHLALCSACRTYRRQITSLECLIRGHAQVDPDHSETLTPEAKERIRQALRRR